MFFNISETKYVTEKLTTDVTITSTFLINNPVKKYIAIFFNVLEINEYNFYDYFFQFYIFLSEAIAELLETTFQSIYNLPEPKLPVKYDRKIGNRPAADENKFNAW